MVFTEEYCKQMFSWDERAVCYPRKDEKGFDGVHDGKVKKLRLETPQ